MSNTARTDQHTRTRRASTETKASAKTIELIAHVVVSLATLATLVAAAVVDVSDFVAGTSEVRIGRPGVFIRYTLG